MRYGASHGFDGAAAKRARYDGGAMAGGAAPGDPFYDLGFGNPGLGAPPPRMPGAPPSHFSGFR